MEVSLKGQKGWKQTRLKKEHYLIPQDNTIYTFSIKLSWENVLLNTYQLYVQIMKNKNNKKKIIKYK